MIKKKQKIDIRKVKQALPYIVTAVLTLVLVFVGSLDKSDAATSLSLNTIANSDYDISVDQMSEFYTVANISDVFSLASAQDVANNYVTMRSMYDSGIVATGKIEKPSLPSITVARGVVTYVVQEGDTMESIAAKYNLSTDQIRWSNGRKTTAVAVGDTLYLPSVSGIVYTVKSGDSVESIAAKYGSTATEIITLNDLEISGISEGMRILIKGGSLPETERPEYVAPVVYAYSYYGSSSSRDVINQYKKYGLGGNGNPMAAGQCTWYAWWWRFTYGSSYDVAALPTQASAFYGYYGGFRSGNAANWGNLSSSGYRVDNIPAPGAVFVDKSRAITGHVGIVLEVLPDNRIKTTEMNYAGPYWVTEAYISADTWSRFTFVH